jgi:hypothetical protein
MRSWKKILAGTVIVALAGGGYGWYLYHKAPPDIRRQKAGIVITAFDLLKAFQHDEEAAGKQYVDHVLIVEGTVTDMQTDSSGQATVYLDAGDQAGGVVCSFYPDDKAVKTVVAGAVVRIKGICTGMLTDVVLNRCSIVE